MRGCVSLMKTGSADAWEREWSEWSIQRRQSARRLKLAEVDGFVVCLAGLSCGRSEVQAAGHFEVEGEFDVGVADAELGDGPFQASQVVVDQCVEAGEVVSPSPRYGQLVKAH